MNQTTRMSYTLRLVIAVLLCTGCACTSVATGEQDRTLKSAAGNDTLRFSTFLGKSGEDTIRDVATDLQGNIIITGGTASANFPATAGSFDTSFNGVHDVFVAKLDPSGAIIWVTLIGGPEYDRAYAIEVDALGFVYVAGRAGQGFPTSPGCLQPSFAGDVVPNSIYKQQDGFITKLSPDGDRIIWSTYFGSDGRDFVRDLAVDGAGNVYIGVSDVSRSHPHVTSGAFQTSLNGPSDGIVARLSSDGKSVLYASYFGGSGDDGGTPSIRVHTDGSLYYLTHSRSGDAPVSANAIQPRPSAVDNTDLMLARVSPDGSSLLFSTYFGGNGNDFTETHGLAIDQAGNAYIAITTTSTDLPATAGAFQGSYAGRGTSGKGSGTNYAGDVFVAKVSPNGTKLLAGTYVGGRHGEGAEGIAVDSQGSVYFSGATYSDDFPVTPHGYQTAMGGDADLFAVKLSTDLQQMIYGSYLGGGLLDYGRAATVDAVGNIYVAGMSKSSHWPTLGAAQASYGGDWDGVLAKFTTTPGGPSLSPRITGASVSGKKLFVTGENFDLGSEIILNDKKEKKVSSDLQNPTTLLIAKKAGKKIAVGDTVRLQVRNSNGALSEVFSFARPAP